MELQPLDILVFDLKWYIPYHWPIAWRSLDAAVHCVIVNSEGKLVSADPGGIHHQTLDNYEGRDYHHYRYNGTLDRQKILDWLTQTETASGGYDFLHQYILGFILGISSKLADNENYWTCSEICYWAFQDTGHTLTSKDERLPLPRMFKYNDHFSHISSGRL